MTCCRKIPHLFCVITLLMALFSASAMPVRAGIYEEESATTYQEIWVNHTEFTGGCDDLYFPNGSWFLEPGKLSETDCRKILDFQLPSDLSRVTKIEAYFDIWLGRSPQNVQFKLNNHAARGAPVGLQFSRTPLVMELPKSEFRPGANTIQFWNQSGKYHIHDLAFRLHYAPQNPLPGQTPPNATLLSISDGVRTVDPSAGGVLNLDNDRITLTVGNVSSDAQFVEFHAYYDGYDEDNDGVTLEWHNRDHNNCHPGAIRNRCKLPPNTGGTIDHIGTVVVGSAATYSIVWQTTIIKAQSGVRFKIRVVDADGNARDAAGGVSAPFTLERSRALDTFFIANFQDVLLHADGKRPDVAERVITLPADLSRYQKAYIVGSYWKNPKIEINGNPSFFAFQSGESDWALSVREFNISYLRPGQNTIKYLYNSGFGHLVEKPGPMIVLKQTSGSGGGGSTATLRARKYRDSNRNGRRNQGESWLANWTIKLYNAQGAEVGSQTTNSQGKASFTNLPTGAYTICEVLTSGWRNTQPGSRNATYNQPCYNVTLSSGQTVQVTFGNIRATTAASEGTTTIVNEEAGIVVFPPGVDGSAGDTDTDATWLAVEDADEDDATDAPDSVPVEEKEESANPARLFLPVVKP